MDAGEVEDGELVLFRGVGARVSFKVTELTREAEQTEENFIKKLAIPSLHGESARYLTVQMWTDLDAMEGQVGVRVEETILTTYVNTRAVFAPKSTRLLADGTDETATSKAIQTQDPVHGRLSPWKPLK